MLDAAKLHLRAAPPAIQPLFPSILMTHHRPCRMGTTG